MLGNDDNLQIEDPEATNESAGPLSSNACTFEDGSSLQKTNEALDFNLYFEQCPPVFGEECS